MANNRMYFKCLYCAEQIYIARSNFDAWDFFTDNSQRMEEFVKAHLHVDLNPEMNVSAGGLIMPKSSHFKLDYDADILPDYQIEYLCKYIKLQQNLNLELIEKLKNLEKQV